MKYNQLSMFVYKDDKKLHLDEYPILTIESHRATLVEIFC